MCSIPKFLLVIICSTSSSVYASQCSLVGSSSGIKRILDKYVTRGANGRDRSSVFLEYKNKNFQRILFEENKDRKQAVASIQKILTAYTAYKRGWLSRREGFTEDDLFFDEQGYRARYRGGSEIVQVGDRPQLYDYLYSLLTQSSNGSANALARGSQGTIRSFMMTMNAQAKNILGSRSKSFFQNPSGLTDDGPRYRHMPEATTQGSTAWEMASLMGYIVHNDAFMEQLESVGVPNAKGRYFWKGGSTNAAGKTLVLAFPLEEPCETSTVVLSVFGEARSDQFNRYRAMYAELKSYLNQFD